MIRKGSSGDGARWVQWQLRKHGGDPEVDGSFGEESQRTLRAFQQAFGVTADGVCGPTTRARLRADREEKTLRSVLFAAASQIGVTERPSGSNRVKYNTAYYGREVSGKAYPWCVTYLWWVFRQAGMTLYKTASCTAFLNRYQETAPPRSFKGTIARGISSSSISRGSGRRLCTPVSWRVWERMGPSPPLRATPVPAATPMAAPLCVGPESRVSSPEASGQCIKRPERSSSPQITAPERQALRGCFIVLLRCGKADGDVEDTDSSLTRTD